MIEKEEEKLRDLTVICARMFCTYQNELKFDLLPMFLELCSFESWKKKKNKRDYEDSVCVNMRKGMFDIIKAQKTQIYWSVFRVFVELSNVLSGDIVWSLKNNDGFFPLFFALVGVEFSMAFDSEKDEERDERMLMVCGEIMELVMRGLREAEELLQWLKAEQILQMREKLNDINRVALAFLLSEEEEKSAMKLRSLKEKISVKIVSTWAFLDPESMKEKETTLLQTVCLSHLPLFLNCYADYWCDNENICQRFLELNGFESVCSLIRENVIQTAQTTARNEDSDSLELWNEFAVNAFDSIVNCCTIVLRLSEAKKIVTFGKSDAEEEEELLHNVAKACRMLMGKSEDCSTLLSFLLAFLTHYLKLRTKTDLDKRQIKEQTKEEISRLMASFIPVALCEDSISTVQAMMTLIERDFWGIKRWMKELDTLNTLQNMKNQTEIAKRLIKILKQR